MTTTQLQEVRFAREWAASGAAKAIREGAGLSLGEVARSLGVSPSSVLRWERAEFRPRERVAARYAALLRDMMERPQ